MFIKAIESFLEWQIWVVHCSLSISIIWGTAIMSMSNIGDFATNSLLVYWRWEFQIWNTISLMSACAQHGQKLTTHNICCKKVLSNTGCYCIPWYITYDTEFCLDEANKCPHLEHLYLRVLNVWMLSWSLCFFQEGCKSHLQTTQFSLMKLPFRHCRYKASQYGGPDRSNYSLWVSSPSLQSLCLQQQQRLPETLWHESISPLWQTFQA